MITLYSNNDKKTQEKSFFNIVICYWLQIKSFKVSKSEKLIKGGGEIIESSDEKTKMEEGGVIIEMNSENGKLIEGGVMKSLNESFYKINENPGSS